MSEPKIYDCKNTNTILDTRKYVLYDEYVKLYVKLKEENELLKAKLTATEEWIDAYC